VACTAGGDTIVSEDNSPIILDFRNDDASSKVITVEAGMTPLYPKGAGVVTKAPLSFDVPGTQNRLILLDPSAAFRDPTTNNIDITYSAVNNCTIRAFKLP
jgi:hypothetical protein